MRISARAHSILAIVVAGSLIVCLSLSSSLIYTADLSIRQPICFVWLNAETILLFLRQQPDVAHLAAVYLKYASIGLPAYAFNCLSRCDLYPTKGTRLTFFKSIFPVTGSLCGSYPDYPRGRAH